MMRGHRYFLKAGGLFSRVFSTPLNPLYHLGTIAIYMFAIAFVSGIYLFFFYTVDPTQSYNSTVEIMDQWLGNIMRNLHRYSSDAFVIFVFLHFLHMLITGKFKRVTSWIFGIISLIITIFIGLTGFLLVWDQKAKLLGLLTAKLMIYLPIFDPSIAGAFLYNDLAYLGGIFRVTLFAHVFFCAFTAIFLWLHEMHLSKAGVFPPKRIMLFSGIFLLGISIFFDASIDPPAQDSALPLSTTFDWFYFFGYYMMKVLPVGGNWLLMLLVTILLIAFPFLFKKKKPPMPDIDKSLCDACEQCIEDCPYEAISLKPDEGGENRADINYDKCVGCNICVGSCKSLAIESINVSPEVLNYTGKTTHVVACQSLSPDIRGLDKNIQFSEVICIGNLNAKTLDIENIKDDNKLILVGCESCYYRFGADWAKVRMNRKRRPVSRPSVNFNNILFVSSGQNVAQKIREFIEDKAPSQKRRNIRVVEWPKVNYILATVISLLLFLSIPVLSNAKLHFYSPTDRTVILSLKYISSPVEETSENSSRLSHMQSPVPIITRRSSITIDLLDKASGAVIYSKEFQPRGLRKDVAIYVFDEIIVPGPVSLILRETEFPDIIHTIEDISLSEGESVVVRFEHKKLQL
jgi:quinol-cytochrome oxidoreductase complex cytochrome b subunit/ferredoxin